MMPDEINDSLNSFITKNYSKIFLVLLLVMIGLFASIFLPADSFIEQAAEKEIEIITGYEIDFTPEGVYSPPPMQSPKGMNGIKGPM